MLIIPRNFYLHTSGKFSENISYYVDIDEAEYYVNSIVRLYALPKHVSKQKILDTTLVDTVMRKLT
jgi:hypothetical protein